MEIDKKDIQFIRQHHFSLKRIFGKMVEEMRNEAFNPTKTKEEKLNIISKVESLVIFLKNVQIFAEDKPEKPENYT